MLEVMRKISTNNEVNDDYDSDDAIGTVFDHFTSTTIPLPFCHAARSSAQVCLISVDSFDASIL